MAIKIDKGIPIPQFNLTRGRKPVYPWRDMEVGDSFLFTEGTTRQNAHAACYMASVKHKPKIFKYDKEGDALFRCWRIE